MNLGGGGLGKFIFRQCRIILFSLVGQPGLNVNRFQFPTSQQGTFNIIYGSTLIK